MPDDCIPGWRWEMPRKSIADLAYSILEENHRPMHYRKITEEIMKIKEIKAENPHHDVNALMGVDQRFVRYQRGIWGLIKWKYREANLPYTLTSYCLRNGTIFLTSYLKPYFSWHRDDSIINVIFIDSEGEEIKAVVDYRQKLISGFKEWYQKRKLEVNDTILIGLIDETKKKYFIIVEKEIKYDTNKDMGDTIYQILHDEGKPLSFLQIYSEITKQEAEQKGLFERYIQDILRNDVRFVLINKEQWGLLEWLNEAEQLYLSLYYADNPEVFYVSLQKCFEFLGYDTESSNEFQQELFIARAALAFKSYSLIITGLPGNYDINTIHSLDWEAMKKMKEKTNADSIILFSEKFMLQELIDRASEEGVQLYELSIIDYIIKEHKRIPFSLLDLRIAFNPMHHSRNNLTKLKGLRENQWKNWQLIKMVINIFQAARSKDNFMDINLLVKELDIIRNPLDNGNIDPVQVKSIITILSQEPFKLIELSESGSIILAYPDHLIQEKIHDIWHFIIGEQEIQYHESRRGKEKE